jgi:hypothetical protein
MRMLHVPGAVVYEQDKSDGALEYQGGQKWQTGYRLRIAFGITR